MTHCAIYHTWPETKNAEYENILRLIEAAKNIGLDISVIDNGGYPLFSTLPFIDSHHNRLDRKVCDFAISLHFESPKLNDIYSYYALWNPLDFYFVWGYDKSIMQFASHDDLLSCDSDLADAHASNVYSALNRLPPLPLLKLHHSLSKEVLRPKITDRARAFYIGINWERINNTKGRHHDLLVALDEAGLVDIYGPELFHGVRPWEGFSGYRGSVPFDGRTTIERIGESGICLAFSSASHQSSGVMSNRLFEGLAAGALVIANKHPFLRKFFDNLIFTVDDSLPVEQVISEVKRIIRWARENPGSATEKAQAAQRIFLDRFALEGSLTRLIEQNERRKQSWTLSEQATKSVTGVVLFTETRTVRLEAILENLNDQTHALSAITLIVDAIWYGRNRSKIDEMITRQAVPTTIVKHQIFAWEGAFGQNKRRDCIVGPAVWQALQTIQTDYFFIQKSDEDVFADHASRLLRSAIREGKPCAVSGVIIEKVGEDGRFHRRLEWLAPMDLGHVVFGNETRYMGNALFERRIIDFCDKTTFDLSDGQEHNLLKTVSFLAGGLCYTFSATYVFREQDQEYMLAPLIPIEHQHQFIRDATQGQSTWLDAVRRHPTYIAVPNLFGGSESGSGRFSRPTKTVFQLKPGQVYSLSQGGDGAKLVVAGFHGFEVDGVWIDGLAGTLEFTLAMTSIEMQRLNKLRFEINVQGRAQADTGRLEHATVLVNGGIAGYFEIGSEWQTYVFDVSGEVLEGDPNIRLQLRLDHAETVKDGSGKVIDDRRLGMRVATLAVHLL